MDDRPKDQSEPDTPGRSLSQGEPRAGAEPLIKRGIEAEEAGDAEGALACFRMAVSADPGYAPAHMNLGIALQAAGRIDEATRSLRQAVALDGASAFAHYNLAAACLQSGNFAEAGSEYLCALRLRPEFPEAQVGIAEALEALGRDAEALQALDRAIELRPDYEGAILNRALLREKPARLAVSLRAQGMSLVAQGQSNEALECFRQWAALLPASTDAHNSIGNALWSLGRFSEAQAGYERAIELDSRNADALNNLGAALSKMARLPQAEVHFRQAIALRPDYAEAHNNLAMTLMRLGRVAEAVESCRRAVEARPDYHQAHSNLIFMLDMQEGRTTPELQAERKRWYRQHAQRYAQSIEPHANPPDPERRLRIGYVSADFRRHSACYIFGPIIHAHDRTAFEVFCYSGVLREDEVTVRLRDAADAWRNVQRLSDDALAALVREDRIDVLVDLSGHSEGNRLLAFARKPAPIQVTAWGHATGTGLATMDYFIADEHLIPATDRPLFAEKVVDLPCWTCYEPPAYLPGVVPLPSLGGKPFTFASMNRLEKISDQSIGMWGRIIAACAGSVLLVKSAEMDDERHRETLRSRLAKAGIEPGRVTLLGASSHADHLATYGRIDVALDPSPTVGGISSAEALWMGVPVVTLQGPTTTARHTASILADIGLPEWIGRSADDYVRIACEAARDLPRLALQREGLRARLAASAFGDVALYTRELESHYRAMWRRWCDTAR